jgi:hypothetical protein
VRVFKLAAAVQHLVSRTMFADSAACAEFIARECTAWSSEYVLPAANPVKSEYGLPSIACIAGLDDDLPLVGPRQSPSERSSHGSACTFPAVFEDDLDAALLEEGCLVQPHAARFCLGQCTSPMLPGNSFAAFSGVADPGSLVARVAPFSAAVAGMLSGQPGTQSTRQGQLTVWHAPLSTAHVALSGHFSGYDPHFAERAHSSAGAGVDSNNANTSGDCESVVVDSLMRSQFETVSLLHAAQNAMMTVPLDALAYSVSPKRAYWRESSQVQVPPLPYAIAAAAKDLKSFPITRKFTQSVKDLFRNGRGVSKTSTRCTFPGSICRSVAHALTRHSSQWSTTSKTVRSCLGCLMRYLVTLSTALTTRPTTTHHA